MVFLAGTAGYAVADSFVFRTLSKEKQTLSVGVKEFFLPSDAPTETVGTTTGPGAVSAWAGHSTCLLKVVAGEPEHGLALRGRFNQRDSKLRGPVPSSCAPASGRECSLHRRIFSVSAPSSYASDIAKTTVLGIFARHSGFSLPFVCRFRFRYHDNSGFFRRRRKSHRRWM